MARKKSVEEDTGMFNLLDDENIVDKAQEALLRISTQAKRAFTINSLDDVDDTFYPLDRGWFTLHYALNSLGLKQCSYNEIIGGDGVGKTSLAFTLAGQMMKYHNSPVLYLETESKKMTRDRILRCLDSDKSKAAKMLKAMHYVFTSNIVDCIYQLESWAEMYRSELNIPKHIPLFIIVDSYSKLQSQAESTGRTGYETLSDDKKKKVEKFLVGTSSMKDNLEHAKISQQWGRCLPSFLQRTNSIILTINHQNTKLSTGFGGGGSFMSEDASASYNRTKIGGNALNQNSSLQLIVNRIAFVRKGTEKLADRCKATIVKNSYGPKGREFLYDIEFTGNQAITTYRTFCDWMATDQSVYPTSKAAGRYTCKSLGVESKKPQQFYEACLADEDIAKKLYEAFNMSFCEIPMQLSTNEEIQIDEDS